MIIMALWHDALAEGAESKPMGIRELSRRIDLPFETVRRHVRRLVRAGICIASDDGIALAPAVRRSTHAIAMLRKIHVEAVRLLDGLGRLKVVNYRPRRSSPASRRLDREQTAIVVAAISVLLTAMKALRHFFDGDLVCGLVFTAIRTANIKHITNASPSPNSEVLPDSDRRPVSMMAISNSMGLPYETVRRHAGKLLRQGKCIRVGRTGLMAPASAFHKMNVEANAVHQLVLGFLAEMRAAGVKL
jgi:predicted transcriptional regulator